jgi:hypothetical protein
MRNQKSRQLQLNKGSSSNYNSSNSSSSRSHHQCNSNLRDLSNRKISSHYWVKVAAVHNQSNRTLKTSLRHLLFPNLNQPSPVQETISSLPSLHLFNNNSNRPNNNNRLILSVHHLKLILSVNLLKHQSNSSNLLPTIQYHN